MNILLCITTYNSKKFLGRLFYYLEQLNSKPSFTLFVSTDYYPFNDLLYIHRNYKVTPYKIINLPFCKDAVKQLGYVYDTIAIVRQTALEYARKHNYNYIWFNDDDNYPLTPNMFELLTEHPDNYLVGAPYCVDENTEALTLDGWKKGTDVTINDSILIYKNGKLQYEKMQNLYKTQYKGYMIKVVAKHSVDMLLTPNHNFYYLHRIHGHGKKKDRFEWRIKKAENITCQDRIRIGAKNKYGKTRINKYLAELCGWILTDGYMYNRNYGYGISVYQTLEPHPEKVERIKFLLDNLSIKYTIHKRQRFHGNNLRTEFEFYLSAKDEKLKWIRDIFRDKRPNYNILNEWDKFSLKALLKGIILGDGYKDDKQYRIVGMKEYIDFYQALAIRLGYSSFGQKNGTICSINKKQIKGLQRAKIEKIYYDGVVWCPQVSSGLWLARRNGKIFITGNSRVYPEGVYLACKWGTLERGKYLLKKISNYPLDFPVMISGGAMLIPKRIIQDARLNFYPIHIEYSSSEDYGYCLAARKLGYLCLLDCRVKMHHEYIKTIQDIKPWTVNPKTGNYFEFNY